MGKSIRPHRAFAEASARNRNSIYGVVGTSQVGTNKVTCTNGTGFMLAPGILVTAAHLVHIQNDSRQPAHQIFEVIRAPDVGQSMERAALIAEDAVRDIALLRIEGPRSSQCLKLERDPVGIGTACGSLGFPLAEVLFTAAGKGFNLVERFQGANISAFYTGTLDEAGTQMSVYETDALMYRGSSGCPGFLRSGRVFGMHNRSRTERRQESQGRDGNGRTVQNDSEVRLAISLWVPSMEIRRFADANNIRI